MNVREATVDDGSAIREVARESMYESYSLDSELIDDAIAEWYDDEELDAVFADDDRVFLVGERDGDVVGFVDAVVDADSEDGDILWLHVHPDHRGEGLGNRLFDEAFETLQERGAEHLRGLVLADNTDGNTFYRNRDFQKIDAREIEIEGETLVENVYQNRSPAEMTAMTDDDGETVYVDENDTESGTITRFHRVYVDEDKDEQWGFFCSNCESLATAMDGMGRVECSECGNTMKPMRWDAAYL